MAFEFYPGGIYRENVPTIESVLGYAPGERLTRYADLVRYLTTLEQRSDRALLRTYGTTYEGRAQYYLIISDPANLGRLEETKLQIAKLADPSCLGNADEAAEIIAETPAITWIGANVHGGEHSTMEAAMCIAYQLAAGEDETTRHILNQTVVIIDPLQNPDGRERSVNYFYSAFGLRLNSDPNAAEHREPWPGGRGNHYLFDLNRDWFPITQQDTVGKIQAYLEWHPQVYADLHEMGPDSTYFFFPPAKPINQNLPEQTIKWWEIYGKAIAEAFDKHGFDYFTAEIFDSFYPGYGESWPAFQGATGMTFEQAGVRGIQIKRSDERTLHFRDAIWHHFTAAMATCNITANHRAERLRDFYLYHQTAIEEGRSGESKEFIIHPGDRGPDVARLMDNLMLQGIEVYVADEKFTATDVHNYDGEFAYSKEFPKGSYIIRLDQPRKRLIQTLFEQEAIIDATFLKAEQERKATKRSSQIYDITSWSVPLAQGIETYWTNRFTEVSITRLQTSPPTPPLKWEGREEAPSPSLVGKGAGGLGKQPTVAYLLPYTSNAAAKCLGTLLQRDYRVHVAREGFQLNGKPFDRGTLVIKVGENKGDLHEQIATLAASEGVEFTPTDTGWTESGIKLGSREVVYLKRPKIAVLYDVPASSLSYGWIAYLFEQRYGLEFSAIRLDILTDGELNDYNVIVFPNGSADTYRTDLGEGGLKRLKTWVQNGGTLVLIKGAAAFGAHDDVQFTTSQQIHDLRKLSPDAEKEKPQETQEDKGEGKAPAAPDEPIPEEYKPDEIHGAVLKVKLDPHHFLNYGYGEVINVLIDSDYLFTPSKEGHNAATFVDSSRLRVSGLLSEKMAKALPNQAYLIDEPTGKGHVILFADDPNFRAAWDGLTRLFLNSIFFGPSLRR